MLDTELLLSQMGDRIVTRRKQLNLSQEELAEKANVTVQMLSTAERGAKAIRPVNLLKISLALNVSTDFLLTGTTTSIDNSLLEHQLSTLSRDQRIALENIIANFVSICKQKEEDEK